MADVLRTTSFRIAPDLFGDVLTYRAGGRFRAAWQRVNDMRDQSRFRHLPYGSLTSLLRLRSSDFVRLQVATNTRDPYFIVSKRRISHGLLAEALLAWEHAVLGNTTGILAEHAEDFEESREPIRAHLSVRAGQCFTTEGWVWDAAMWEAAHRLAAQRLVLDEGQGDARINCLLAYAVLARDTWFTGINISQSTTSSRTASDSGRPSRRGNPCTRRASPRIQIRENRSVSDPVSIFAEDKGQEGW